MTTRKRKQPEKKKKARRGAGTATIAVVTTGLTAAGRLASRNPRTFAGSVTFVVVFSFVAANALWYQPGTHPSPFMRTRLPFAQPEPARLGQGEQPGTLTPRKVTTFVIQREAETKTQTETKTQRETASLGKAGAQPDIVPEAIPTQPSQRAQPGSALVVSIQKELARHGLYDGPADGKTGPKTALAILHFEKQTGRPQTGSASDTLLAALQQMETAEPGKPRPAGNKGLAAAKPLDRPYEKVAAGKGELDPVAAAIRNAAIDPQFIPKADIPASSEVVMTIQKGLTNLAYTDVSIDGVAGEQTRSAIRHFEKHYRLPQTGQPSDKVLKKMKEIGAL